MSSNNLRITAIAAAVGLACSGAALAQQDSASQDMAEQMEQAMDRAPQPDMPGPDVRSSDWENAGSMSDGNAETGSLLSDVDAQAQNLTKFKAAVEKAGLADALMQGGEYTVFAPTDEAFDALGQERTDELMSQDNVEQLRDVLRSHIVAGKVEAAQAKQLNEARVLTGDTVKLTTENDELRVANATVLDANIASNNLTIHTIDQIIDLDSTGEEEEAE